MSEHTAAIRWTRQSEDFSYGAYNRGHEWSFDAGITVPASAAPAFLGDEDRVDPEEAFVATVSSCHMLTFLAIASRKRLVVDSYADDAVGTMEQTDEGVLAITNVHLKPVIEFGGDAPAPEAIAKMHQQAHKQCFIANSIRTKVTVHGEGTA